MTVGGVLLQVCENVIDICIFYCDIHLYKIKIIDTL